MRRLTLVCQSVIYQPAVGLLLVGLFVLLLGCKQAEKPTVGQEVEIPVDVVQQAKDLVHEGTTDCVLVKNGKTLFRHKGHSVSYLLGFYGEEKEVLEGTTLVERAVSRAVATIAICGKVAHVHGETMSRSAVKFLKEHDIAFSYTKLLPRMQNEDGSGPCPWEQAVEGISDPEEALKVLNFGLRTMQARPPRPWGQRMSRFREKNVLIVYFSYGGTTRDAAKLIQTQIGGDLLEIKPVNAYPQEANTLNAQVKQELEDGVNPEICQFRENVQDYDLIFVGSPCWWYTIAPPVATFLEQQDLSGKVVIPFITHEGSEIAHCEKAIKALCPDSAVLKSLPIYSKAIPRSEDAVRRWLRDLEF